MTISRTLGRGLLLGSAVLALGVGCLARPVVKQDPTTKVNFTTVVKSQAIDKVDLLLAIDNSGSMGDKQAILAKAIPDLVGRLINPSCVDADKKPTNAKADPLKSASEQCPPGSEPEFKPVVDLHLGIVSSSLGGLGSTSCAGDANNDRGRLIARSGKNKGQQAANVESSGFLSWFPKAPGVNDTKEGKGLGDQKLLIDSFADAVQGTDQTGCGLEAQLESFYHFLIQPDPWDSIKVEANRATYQGIDETILQQRKDFLRPDSLVAIIMLTDEDDSSADPLSIGGQGWAFMDQNFPGSKQARSDGVTTTAPRGTSPCDGAPTDPKCTSCGFAAGDATVAADANCKNNNGYYGADEDSLNVRFFQMKRRYGVDPQYPIKRYVDGLRNRKVPNAPSEHDGAGKYLGTGACINPLFAKNLPGGSADAASRVKDTDAKGNKLTDQQRIASGLCNLEPGPRSADLVFFAVVGGAPNDLLFDGAYTDTPTPKPRVDFAKLVGTAPDQYNYSGQDAHMIQSINPREGLPGPDKVGANGSDPAHGREWDTRRPSATGVTEERDDLQFACTFPLEAPLGAPRPCTDPKTCDCDGKKAPPLCGGADGKTQVRAKAYPTVRQFTLAKLLGDQGIVGSLCPLVDSKGKLFPDTSEFFGYRPAVRAIIDRLKNALAQQCLPQPLTPDDKNEVPCLILVTLANQGGQELCDGLKDKGLSRPTDEVLKKFREQQLIEFPPPKTPNDYDVTKYPVCQVAQIAQATKGQSCAKDPRAGWCYVVSDGKTGGQTCPQAILFSENGNPPVGARVSLQCIQQFGGGVAAGDKPTP